MAFAGAPPEAIALAVEAIENVQAEIERKRAVERDRKRRQRANGQDNAGTVTGQSRDSHGDVPDKPLSRPPNEINSNPPTHTPGYIYPARAKPDDFPKLDCASAPLWADFLTNRKRKRLPNTPSAHRKLIADLETMSARTGWPPGQVFEACVAKGWGAIYDPRDEDNGRSRQNGQTSRESTRTIGERVAARLALEDGNTVNLSGAGPPGWHDQ